MKPNQDNFISRCDDNPDQFKPRCDMCWGRGWCVADKPWLVHTK